MLVGWRCGGNRLASPEVSDFVGKELRLVGGVEPIENILSSKTRTPRDDEVSVVVRFHLIRLLLCLFSTAAYEEVSNLPSFA